MNVEEIYDFLKANTEGGKLKVSSSTISGGVEYAIDTFFGGSLSIGGVTLTKEKDKVVARGAALGAPFDGLDLAAEFFDAGGKVGAQATANLRGDWSFANGFPRLKGTFLEQALVSDGALTLANARGGTISGSATAAYARSGSRVDLGTAYFQARAAGNAYLAGFTTPATFAPSSIWSALGRVFDILEFSDSGIIYSTFEASRESDYAALTHPSVPDTVRPGVTFYTTLRLGGVLEVLGWLFGRGRSLQLSGAIDLAEPVNSVVTAQLSNGASVGALTFTRVLLHIHPKDVAFDLDTKAELTVGGSKVALAGGGTVNVTARSARLNIIIPEWKNALGIPRLAIRDFGLGIAVESSGAAADFLGHFEIGTDKKVGFVLGGKAINFAEPTVLTFTLDKPDPQHPLKLSDIIQAFTSLDLGSVPLLKDIAFRELAFHAVADPAGYWIAPPTKEGEEPLRLSNGIGLRADLRVFSWDLRGGIEVNEKKGIKAWGEIVQPIKLLGILTISAQSDANKGPSFLIDTSKLAPRVSSIPAPRLLAADDAYFAFDGRVSLMGITSGFKGAARQNGFDVDFVYDLLGLFRANFHAEYEQGQRFHGVANGAFDLRVSLPAVKIGGVTVLPALTIPGPSTATTLEVKVSSSEAWLKVNLKFDWLGIGFNVEFTLDAMKIANLLSNLWETIKTWIVEHVEEFMKDVIGTAEKFVKAIEAGIAWTKEQAKEIAAALKAAYNYTAEQVSKVLTQIGCAVESIVRAVADAFSYAYDEAARVVTDAVKTCGAGMTNALINA